MLQMSESTIPVITTAGQLALQETTRIHSSSDLQRGSIIRLKATKPVSAKPYGYAEVLIVEEDQKYTVRRFS
jgi:hypothetical protein